MQFVFRIKLMFLKNLNNQASLNLPSSFFSLIRKYHVVDKSYSYFKLLTYSFFLFLCEIQKC